MNKPIPDSLYKSYLKWEKDSKNEQLYDVFQKEMEKFVGNDRLDQCKLVVLLAKERIVPSNPSPSPPPGPPNRIIREGDTYPKFKR